MNRRDAILGPLALGSAALAGSQVPGRTYRVGYLGLSASHAPAESRDWSAFVQRLQELGYVLGGNLIIKELYTAGRRDRYAAVATEIVKFKADVVVVVEGQMARYVMGLSRAIPIVAVSLADPVRSGLIASLARPGGQLTGLSDLSDDLVPKQLELLKAAVPSAKRIAHARCPFCAWGTGLSRTELRALHAEQEASAQALGVTLVPVDLNATTNFDGTASVIGRNPADALLIGANGVNAMVREQWLAFATRYGLPTMASYRGFGAMLCYGPDLSTIHRRVAEYVAKILAGAMPEDLPMEQPTEFLFVVNLRMAKAIGVTIPQSVLLQATEVVQ